MRFFSENTNFPPFNLLMFCDRMDVEKPQRVPLSSFSALCDFFLFFFLPKGSPFNFFDILQQIVCLKIPKGPLFQFFGIMRLFFENLFFLQRVPSFNCDKNVDNFGSVPFSARQGPLFSAPLGPFFCLFDFRVL